MRDWFNGILFVASVVLVTSCVAFAQEVQVAIVVIGDMHGEEFRIRNDIINTSTKGVKNQRAYFSLGKGDSSEMLNRIYKTTFYLKKRRHFKFKKIQIDLPEKILPYLILERKRNARSSFFITWTDKLPFKLESEKLIVPSVDTAGNLIPKPDLSIQLLGRPITADQLRVINPSPGRLLPLVFSFEAKDSKEVFPQMKSMEILFLIQQNQVVARSAYGKSYAVSLFWPDRFPLTQGSVMLINVVYEYLNREKQVVETGIVSKRISF